MIIPVKSGRALLSICNKPGFHNNMLFCGERLPTYCTSKCWLWGRVFQFSFRKTRPLKVRKCQKINFPHDTPTKSVVMETRHNPKSPLLSFTVSFSHIETPQYRIGQNIKATRRIFYVNNKNGRFFRRKIAWSSFLKAVQIWSWKLSLEIICYVNF